MPGLFPKGRTAFFVIHGIGQQDPFETLDEFTRGFLRHLQVGAVPFKIGHRITQRQGAAGTGWIESFVRIRSLDEKDWIDIHEYYWAYLTEREITAAEVWQWIGRTLDGTIRFYEKNRQLLDR